MGVGGGRWGLGCRRSVAGCEGRRVSRAAAIAAGTRRGRWRYVSVVDELVAMTARGGDGKAKVLMVEVTEVVMMEMTAKVSDGRRWQQ